MNTIHTTVTAATAVELADQINAAFTAGEITNVNGGELVSRFGHPATRPGPTPPPREHHMRKSLTVLTLTAGIAIAGAPGVAQARPVLDPVIEVGDCGPGMDWKVFSLTDPRGYTVTCLGEPEHAIYQRPVLRPSMDRWWNPWSWFN